MKHRKGWIVAGVFAAACGGSPPVPEPAPAATPPPARAAAPVNSGPTAADRTREAEEARRELARKRAVLEEMVFFDFDATTLRPEARELLDAKAQILRAEPAIRIRIAGHADERGSTEYNLALGARRADAIRQHLTGFGLAANRFETTSYGEARPLVPGRDEGTWSRNRRGEFTIQTGLAPAP